MSKIDIYKKDIINQYLKGESLRELAKKFDCDKVTIKKLLIRNNIKIEFRSNGKRKNELNEKYFEIIDTEKKAYFLGLMFADGYVLKDGYCSGINLINEDRYLLENFSNEVYSSKNPVYDLKKNRHKPQSRLIFKSREFQDHLISKGCVHRKSKILKPPLNVPENLIKYFILGYFDGDGSCYKNWNIVSTKPFCEWVANILEKQGVDDLKINETENGITFRLWIGKKHNLIKIYKYLYSDEINFNLKRKQDLLRKYLF